MKVIQIHTLLNTSTSEMLGKEGIVKEDLSDIISIINSDTEPEPVVNRNYWAIAKKPWHSHIAHLGDGIFTNVRTQVRNPVGFGLFNMNALELPLGETYTLSFEISVSSEDTQFSSGRLYINGENPETTHNNPTLVAHDWVKVHATFDYVIENNGQVRIYLNNVTEVDTFQIRKFKLEKGDKVTDWILAQEDVNTE